MPIVVASACKGHPLAEQRQSRAPKSYNGAILRSLPFAQCLPCGPIRVLTRGTLQVKNSASGDAEARVQHKVSS